MKKTLATVSRVKALWIAHAAFLLCASGCVTAVDTEPLGSDETSTGKTQQALPRYLAEPSFRDLIQRPLPKIPAWGTAPLCQRIDFETDPSSNVVPNGTQVDTTYSQWGVDFFASRARAVTLMRGSAGSERVDPTAADSA